MNADRKPWYRRALAVFVPVALVLAVAAIAAATPAEAANQNSKVFPPNANPYGKSLGAWGAEWWTWMGQFPYAVNPINDNGIVQYGDADEQPDGHAWFLAGTFGGTAERTLSVPKGKALLMPLINSDVWSPEDCWWIGASLEPNACAAGDLQTYLDTFYTTHVTALSMTLDGQAITDLFDYRATSGSFALSILPNTLWTDFGYTPGTRNPNLSDGYYVMLKPPSLGAHELHFSADVDGTTVQNMTYHLTVVNN